MDTPDMKANRCLLSCKDTNFKANHNDARFNLLFY